MAYATVTNVKEHLNISGSAQDAFLSNLITEVESVINLYCVRGDGFASASHTEYYDGGGIAQLTLTHTPVTAIASVYDDLDGDFGSDTLVGATEYRVARATGELVNKDSIAWQDGVGNIKITYTGGYSTIPADIRLATIRLTAKFYNLRSSSGIKQMTAGALNLSFDYSIPDDVKVILNKYRKIDF